ncbi:MAG: YtxH domain-containing protein [Chitinophagaceae bacterium]
MNKSGKILAALVAGIAAGAVLGVLFAPDKGSETRKKINDQGKKLADGLKDTIETAKERFNNGKEKLKDLKEDFT